MICSPDGSIVGVGLKDRHVKHRYVRSGVDGSRRAVEQLVADIGVHLRFNSYEEALAGSSFSPNPEVMDAASTVPVEPDFTLGSELVEIHGFAENRGDTLLKFVRASLVHDKIGDGVGAASRFPVLGLVKRLPVVQAGQWVAVGGFYSHIPSLSLPLLLRHQGLVQTIPRSGRARFTRGNRAPTARGLG